MAKSCDVSKSSMRKYRNTVISIQSEIAKNVIKTREERPRTDFTRSTERILLQIVSLGNVSMIDNFLLGGDNEYIHMFEPGHVSTDTLQEARYMLVAMITILSRHCIDVGLSEEVAFLIGDTYISYADKCKNLEEICVLILSSIREYTITMRTYRYQDCSRPVRKCLDYINAHIFQPISLSDLANFCGLSLSYTSDLFYKELGLRPTEYIRKQRLENAKIFLNDSNDSISAIAERLCFASPSAFCAQFKKAYGITPYAYRREIDSSKLL